MNTVAKNIKKIRENSNYSQQELAERIIVTRQAISNWERGVSQPDVEILEQIADALEVHMTDLIHGQQPATAFMKAQPSRIRRAVILGALWLVSLGLMVFLIPELYRGKLDYEILPYWVGYCTIFPAVYGLGGALLFSLLAIWCDFRLRSLAIRIALLAGGLAIVVLYPILLFCTSWTAFHVWIWENPFFFIIPGVFFFCGFNKKPIRSLSEDIRTEEAEADEHAVSVPVASDSQN